MNKLIFISLVSSLLFLSFGTHKDRKIDANLVSIEYYSKGICKENYPVYIRVKYSIENINTESIKMRHTFLNGITATMPITETDKRGNVVYGFCSASDEIKSFTTVFYSAEGAISKNILIEINVPDAKIIAGTAPQTIKK